MCIARTLSYFLLSVLLTKYVWCLTRQSDIVFQHNGYSDVLIAVQDTVRNDGSIVTKIQNVFKSASQFLYKSTRQRAYFKTIKILVPSTWYDPSYQTATTETLQNADIIIHNPSKKRSIMATRSYAGCGRQGIHVVMNTDFILNARNSPISGYPDKYIVQEWAKFRWGVFEEYPSPGENPFYFSTQWGRPDAVKCTALLRGRQNFNYPNGTLGYCPVNVIDPITGLVPENCVYTPYPYGNRLTTASVMDHQYIREIVDFCDDFGQYKTQHNREPPNRQNRLCGHRSTWDVIMNTTDFVGNINPPRNLTAADIVPQFTVYRLPRRRRSVIIINSPRKNQEVDQKLFQSAAHFIHSADDYHEVVVAHHSNSKSRIRTIRSAHDKKKAMRILSKTSIDMSKVDFDTVVDKMFIGVDEDVGKHVVLLTDSDVTDKINKSQHQSSIRIDIMQLGGQDWLLKNDTKTRSNGFSYHFDHGHPTIDSHVDNVYHVIEKSAHSETPFIQLYSNTKILMYGANHSDRFIFDDSLNGNIIFCLTANGTTPVMKLVSPSGNTYDETSKEFEKLDMLRIARLRVAGEVGQWQFYLKSKINNCKTTVTIISKSNPNYRSRAIKLEAWTRMDRALYPPRFTIFGYVTHDLHPIVDMNVIAYVHKTIPQYGEPVSVQLFDNGAGADIKRNDGIYSRYFTNFTGNGHYSIRVMIEGRSTQATAIQDISRFTSVGYIPVDVQSSRDHQWIKHGHNSQQYDIYPPSRVFDLEVTHVSKPDMTLTLSWTAPGDDLDHNSAMRYDLRYSHKGIALLDNPNNCASILENDIIIGTLHQPQSAGQTEIIKVNVSSLYTKQKPGFAFRLRAVDDNGNYGEFSNLATAGFTETPL